MSSPAVSICLLTRNGMETLPAVLDAIAEQEYEGSVEVVAVDTASADGTTELLRQRADRLIEIGVAEFNHGATRNFAIEQSSGELVVLLVQDALPLTRHWLAELVAPLVRDPRVGGSFARQVPRPEASRLTRWALLRWVAAQEEARLSSVESIEAWGAMSPTHRFLAAVFDNVCSCLRRKLWQQIPFQPTTIAEDLQWGRDALLAGHCLAYAPGAAVTHSHERSARYELGRTFLVHQRLYELFGMRTIPTAGALWRSTVLTLREHWQVLRHGDGPKPGARGTARGLALAAAWPMGQYLGARSAVTGVQFLKPRDI